MISKKYTKDYRVEARLTKHGRVRDEAVYCGEHFRFARPIEDVRRSFRYLAAAELVMALLTILPMCFPCNYCKQMYVVLPLVLSLIPVYLLLTALYRVRAAGETVIREHRDKIANRFPAGALVQLIMAGLVFAAGVVFVFVGELRTIDWIFCALAGLRAVLAVAVFLRRRDFAMEPAEK